MHRREVEGIVRMEREFAQLIPVAKEEEEETKVGEESAKRERKWTAKVESKFVKAVKESGGAAAMKKEVEGASHDSMA